MRCAVDRHPEVLDDREFLTVEEALRLLQVDDGHVHVFNSLPGILLGTDWSLEAVRECFEAGRPEAAGPMAAQVHHGVACGGYFFATRREE